MSSRRPARASRRRPVRPTRHTQDERSEATQRQLIHVARQLFAQHGYAKVGTEDIVRRALVTRGALYHHYRDKRDLFRAVVEDLEREIAQALATAVRGTRDAWEQVRLGSLAYLDLALRPDVQRILLVDARSVLGWARWREIDRRHGFGGLCAAVGAAMRQGTVEGPSADALSHVILGSLEEAGIALGHADNPERARRDFGVVFDTLFRALAKRRSSRS